MFKLINLRSLTCVALVAFISSQLIGCGKTNPFSNEQLLPKFELTLLDGTKINESQIKGHVAIVNFWATTCSICVKEMPEMIKLYQTYENQGFKYVAIAMPYDPPMYVIDFAKTRKLPFLVAMDSDATVGKAFGGIEATPTTFLINKEGRIIKKYIGEPNWNELRKLIEAALSQGITN